MSKGLYVHIPFCRAKCPYCDFYSVTFSAKSADEYADAVVRNIERYGEVYDTVYFGGGTPSLLSPQIGRILKAARTESGAEITAECNPCTVSGKTLEEMRSAGVNRLSLGIQSFDDNELSALGRLHSARQAEDAILLAREYGFLNISADIMLGIPQQTEDSLSHTIERLSKLPVTHISAYMLKIEPDTPFGAKPPNIPDEERTAALYLCAVRLLKRHGFEQYEISNFARTGCECRHNLKYWRREEYVGIGPAAHSFYGGRRYAVPRDIESFISSPCQSEDVTDGSPDESEERIMLGLRLSEGIPEELYAPLAGNLRLIPQEYYRIERGRLSLTAEGFLLSNSIISALLYGGA